MANRRCDEEGDQYLYEIYEKNEINWLRYYRYWLDRLENLVAGKRALDIGCGIGYFVRAANDLGWDAYGLDLSSRAIEFGKRKLGLNNHLIDKSLQEAEFSEKFDLVTLFSVIEHVDDPLDLLLQMKKNLNGLILIKTPSQDSSITKLHWLLYKMSQGKVELKLYNREHIFRFSPETLTRLLDRSGFCVETQEPDDQLRITSTRYSFQRAYKSLLHPTLATINLICKIVSMENQFSTIARQTY